MEEEKNEYEENTSKLLYFQLAFESYSDHSGNEPDILIKIYNDIDEIRKKRCELNEEEKIKMQRQVLKECNDFLDVIGRDKFTFHDESYIEYNWDDELLKKEENGKR